MLMSDFEIVRDFKSAAKKGKQIGILADMNGCSREKIREVLLRNGISEAELPGKPGRKATEEEKEIFRPAKTTKQKPGGTLLAWLVEHRHRKPKSLSLLQSLRRTFRQRYRKLCM